MTLQQQLENFTNIIDQVLHYHFETAQCIGGWVSEPDRIVVITLSKRYTASQDVKRDVMRQLRGIQVDACECAFIFRKMKAQDRVVNMVKGY